MTTDAVSGDARLLTFVLFAGFVCVTLGITLWARSRTGGAADFYAGGRAFSARQNGFALAGDYMSAASFLGISGMIALSGYDGFIYSVGSLVAWVPVLLLAGPLRNAGRFTLADVPASRARRPGPVRVAGAVSTVTVSVFYLVAQMVGAGALVALLLGVRPGTTFLGVSAGTAETLTITVVGALMVVYVGFGGMKGTTWVQIVKTVLLMTAGVALTGLVLGRFGFDVSGLLGAAGRESGHGDAFLGPSLRLGRPAGDLDLISLALALGLGPAGLPHIAGRVFTVPDAPTARASVNWAIGLIGAFFLMTPILGFGAAALVGRREIATQDPAGNAAVPQLAGALGRHLAGPAGGDVLLAFVAAVACATILAVVAGLMMAASTSLAHDLFGHVLMLGRPRERQEIAVARVAAVLVGATAVALAVFARHLNVAFLVGLAFAVAASAHLPAIVLSLCWRRFTGSGAVAGIYGGLLTAVLLVVFSPVVSGGVDPVTGAHRSLLPAGVDFSWFPLENPALVSIPVGFLCAIAGTYLSREKPDPARFAALSARTVTGAGAP
ncbi:solute symporter family protein [Actinoallomurus iriomotensis]|uniref:Cation acetate symporter n=1 Tax=Actinoallomurus iriomotensis TaxID=478107 RepID=A0A9W6VJK0_9ACTN|nr:cation acetate symporter [Actinoallomurus iriomotensis]GLY74153.1 cation acetate symporter [Actinoallomurus iriomotensis]